MKRKTVLPPREVLCQIFSYDPETGELKWKERPREHFASKNSWSKFNSQMAGQTAGTKQWQSRKGNNPCCIWVRFRFSGTDYGTPATAVIFSMQGVEIPPGYEVDHENRDPFDNRWVNLRLATGQQNSYNTISTRKSHSLPKGVHKLKKGFRALVRHSGKLIHLGCFPTEELAHQAYCTAVSKLQGEFHCPLWKRADQVLPDPPRNPV